MRATILLEGGGPVHGNGAHPSAPPAELKERIAARLRAAGIDVRRIGRFGLSVEAPPERLESVLGVEIRRDDAGRLRVAGKPALGGVAAVELADDPQFLP